MISDEAERIMQTLLTLIGAQSLAHRQAYDAIIQVLDQIHGRDVRSEVIRSFRALAESHQMLSDDEDDLHAKVAEEMDAFVETLSHQTT